MRVVLKVTAWLLLVVITLASLSPPAYRPVTGAGNSPEHFLIYFATGLAFGLGYMDRWRVSTAGLVTFAVAIELAQLFVPGRHARVSDLIIDAAAACLGIALAWLSTRLFKLQH